MKKMTTLKQLNFCKFLIAAFAFCLQVGDLMAQITTDFTRAGALVERFDYARVTDNTLGQLSDAAAQLSQTLDSAYQIQDFRVFDFGLYLPTLSMSGALSFDQAVSNMYNRIETGGVIAFRNPAMPILRSAAPPAAYVLITHQFQGGGNVRFKMIVKIPGMSQSGADVSGLENALALAGQQAMEKAYAQNAAEDKVASAKAEGLRAIRQILSGKGKPVEKSGGGLILKQATNFVALSGKIIQLPKDTKVLIYCIAPELTNGYLIGFEIDTKEYVAGGSEFIVNLSTFSGYQNRNNSSDIFTNQVSLTPGQIPISFVDVIENANGSNTIRLFTEEISITQDRIEPQGGTFSSDKRLPKLGYGGSTPFQFDDPKSCGQYKEITQMITRLGSDIEIIIQKGSSSGSLKDYLDKSGNASIPVTPKDKSKAKGQIIFTEVDGQIIDAKVILIRDNIKPGRNDYTPANHLEQTEKQIDDAITNAKNRLINGKHVGWNEPAIGTPGRFHCESMTFSEITTVIVEVGISIYESATLPEKIWNEPQGTTAEKGSYPVHGPPVVCGVADGVIGQVTEIPQLVKMGVDLASSPENVKSLISSIADITPEKIIELAEESIKKKWESYTTASSQVRFHTAGQDGVSVASTIIGAGGIKNLVSGFKDGIQKTGETISKGLNNLLSLLTGKLKNKNLLKRLQSALDDPAIKALFTRNPDAVKAWELLAENGNDLIIKNADSIEKIAALLADADFIAKLPGGEAALKDILKAVKNPLDAGTEAKLVNLATHLDNIKALVKNHSGTEGFDRLMTDLKNPNFYMQDGVTHMLESIKNFPAGSIKKFDYEFEAPGTVCTKCRFDVELDPGPPRLIEYKSWGLENIPNISVKQLTEYFGNVSSINEMQYVFNSIKTPDIELVKTAMQKLIKNNAPSIFSRLSPQMLDDLRITSLNDFL
uniref:hypothetical protein n=1 Tax=Haliscomenobacter sp. TaxID=2717303 RepID=UPI003364DE25